MLDSGPLALSYGNVMSFTEPEIHNISQRRQRRTEPRPRATCTIIWWRSSV